MKVSPRGRSVWKTSTSRLSMWRASPLPWWDWRRWTWLGPSWPWTRSMLSSTRLRAVTRGSWRQGSLLRLSRGSLCLGGHSTRGGDGGYGADPGAAGGRPPQDIPDWAPRPEDPRPELEQTGGCEDLHSVLGHHQAGVSQLVLVKPHSPPALTTPQQNCVDGGREQITNDCRDQQDLETAWSLSH